MRQTDFQQHARPCHIYLWTLSLPWNIETNCFPVMAHDCTKTICPHQSVWSWSLMNEFERSQECNEYNVLINIPFSYLTFGAPSFHYQIEFPAKWERVNGCAIHSQFSVDETSVASFWTVCTFYISTVCTFYNFTVGMFCISTVCALCHPEHYLMPGLKWTK